MLTEFGKTVRKHRIDKDMTLREMARRLAVSPTFLSAVETGTKAIPDGLLDRVSAVLDLDIASRAELGRAADASVQALKIDFGRDTSARDREVATLFARQFRELTADDKETIRAILEGRKS